MARKPTTLGSEGPVETVGIIIFVYSVCNLVGRCNMWRCTKKPLGGIPKTEQEVSHF